MPDRFEDADQDRLKLIYKTTDVRRLPITGIVSGYHSLPFTLVGPNDETDSGDANPGSLKLTGKIMVSPKLVLSLSSNDERFADMFPEAEPFMDKSIAARMFSFSTAYKKNYRIRNEHLSVEEFPDADRDLLNTVLNELSRAEIINMGVIWCPQPRFYPISLERFIASVLDKEFR
ncbi:MAG TPA: hypothetical protein VJ385_14530 [Fibrobacteria bacterium]|nr:hypothetical protein [Fibrobacteria bacterium]